MRSKGTIRRFFVSATMALALTGGTAIGVSAPAEAASCKTVQLNPEALQVIRPWMTVPICFDGSRVWQNGNVTGGVNTYGYALNDISWTGTYNGGGSWIGAGMNYRVTSFNGYVSFSCASRWTINAWENVTSFNRGC